MAAPGLAAGKEQSPCLFGDEEGIAATRLRLRERRRVGAPLRLCWLATGRENAPAVSLAKRARWKARNAPPGRLRSSLSLSRPDRRLCSPDSAQNGAGAGHACAHRRRRERLTPAPPRSMRPAEAATASRPRSGRTRCRRRRRKCCPGPPHPGSSHAEMQALESHFVSATTLRCRCMRGAAGVGVRGPRDCSRGRMRSVGVACWLTK